MFGLSWRDFDEAAATLSIRQKVMDVKGSGGLLRKSNFYRREWGPLRKAAGLPADLRFHEMGRHTFVTLLSGERVPLKTAQAMAGHSRPETTLRHYTHAIDGEQEKAAAALDALLGEEG